MRSGYRSHLLAAVLAIGALTVIPAVPAQAAPQVAVGINVGMPTAPPPTRFERLPPPRSGYVWAPGYWAWSQRLHRHVWVDGRWLRARPGYRYTPARWQQGPHGRWHFSAGFWAR